MEYEYNNIGNIGNIVIKWHPTYNFTLWNGERCLSEHETLVEAVQEITETYSEEIYNYEPIPLF